MSSELPSWIQELWAREVNDMLECGNDPKSSDLWALRSREARTSRSRLGKLASDSRSQQSVQMPNWKQSLPKIIRMPYFSIRQKGLVREHPSRYARSVLGRTF